MDLGRGVEPATVAHHEANGDVVLTDPEGQEHRMTPGDVAKYGTAIPAAEPPPPAAGGEPQPPPPRAPGSRTTVDVNGQRVADTSGPAPTAEAIRNAKARGEPITSPPPGEQPRTQADLDRESAEQRSAEARAALAGQAPPSADPIAQAIAADHAELAKPPIHSTVESAPPVATVTESVARPETPAPAAPSAGEARQPPAPPTTVDLTGMGNAITGNLYGGLFEALRQGKDTFAGVRDPVIARAKSFFDQGLVKSPEDLQALVNAG